MEVFDVIDPALLVMGACALAWGYAGVLPRVGPGRALAFALRSRFTAAPNPVSNRPDLVAKLQSRVTGLQTKVPPVIVVTGEKGIGKTRLIDTALVSRCGVMRVDMDSMWHSSVHDEVAERLANSRIYLYNETKAAQRILACYSMLPFMPNPVCVLQLQQMPTRYSVYSPRDFGKDVRKLREQFKMTVIVDAPPNANAKELLPYIAETVMVTVPPMDRVVLEALPQLQALMTALQQEPGIAEVAWAVLGSNIAKWELLRLLVLPGDGTGSLDTAEAKRFLHKEVEAAMAEVAEYKTKHAHMIPVLKRLSKTSDLTIRQREMESLVRRTSPRLSAECGSVLSTVCIDGDCWFVRPNIPALRFVIQHKLEVSPSWEELVNLVTPSLKADQTVTAGEEAD